MRDIKKEFLDLYTGQIRSEADMNNLLNFITSAEENRFSIIKKPRQVGLSTMYTKYLSLTPEKKVLYVGANSGCIEEFIKNLKKTGYGSEADTFKFKVGNIRTCSTKTVMSKLIGQKYDLIIIEEAAYTEDVLSKLVNIYMALTEFGKLMISSTPDKPKGLFYELYTDATEGKNNFVPLSLELPFDNDWVQERMGLLRDDASIQREIYGMFTSDKVKKTETVPAVRVEKLLYDFMLGRIEQISVESGLEMSVTDYIRELIKADVYKNLFNDEV